MANNNKLIKQFCINVDDATAAQVLTLAEYYQRKPAELLRLLLAPALRDLWAKMQQATHPENADPFTVAKF